MNDVSVQRLVKDILEDARSSAPLVVCIGPDVSKAAGIPTPEELSKILLRTTHYFDTPDKETSAFLSTSTSEQVLDFLVREIGKKQVAKILEKHFANLTLKPTHLHTELATLPASAYITTNFDSLMEKCFHAIGKTPNIVLADNDLDCLREENPLLIKLYGSLDSPSSMVLSASDYEKAYSKRTDVESYIRTLFSSGLALFVGFSLQSTNLKNLYEEFCSSSASRADLIILTEGENIFAARLWRKRGARVVPFPQAAEIPLFVRALGEEITRIEKIITHPIQKIRLFLSSSSDMKKEREKVDIVAAQLNRMLGDAQGFHLEVGDWKLYVASDIGRPQEVINRSIGDYDIFVGIMWKRFGSPTGKDESGTEEEFTIAYKNWQRFKKPRILFYFSNMPYIPKDKKEINQWGKVIDFKDRLSRKGLITEYQSREEFFELLGDHLTKILIKWFPLPMGAQPPADFSRYLTYLKNETMYIDIRGLMTGECKVHQFRIDQLYIPLKIAGAGWSADERQRKGAGHSEQIRAREVLLPEALKESRLIIKGDPGAGKSTFLRLITFTLCCKWLGEGPDIKGPTGIAWPGTPPLPIFIPLGDLINHINEWKKKNPLHTPAQEDDPQWLSHFLMKQSETYKFKLTIEDFNQRLEAGDCLLLFDGLDEAPDLTARKKVSSFVDKALKAYPQCRVVMTGRPAAVVAPVMPAGYSLVEIAPLDDASIDNFLDHWSTALYPLAQEKSRLHRQTLGEALRSRPEIQRMARNPVMLTALAVVHWNEARLPEQRAELYESVITWLVRSREQRPGRLSADRCRTLLKKLALAMFTHPSGRQRQVGLRWAAEQLASEFITKGGHATSDQFRALEQAEYFLRDEIVDSGIIVERDHQRPRLEFWHLSFQEYLAACGIAGLLEKDQAKVLFVDIERIYTAEWREVMLLLGGVFYKQGEDKINHLIDEIIAWGPQQTINENLPFLAGKGGGAFWAALFVIWPLFILHRLIPTILRLCEA